MRAHPLVAGYRRDPAFLLVSLRHGVLVILVLIKEKKSLFLIWEERDRLRGQALQTRLPCFALHGMNPPSEAETLC